MAGCRIGCLHRQLVNEYRLARTDFEAGVEAEVWETERAEFRDLNPGITFKEWLIGHRKQQEEAA
ncbi:hypothetical protein [Aeromicrobium sp.]|uniref:hypothetical protein n=1 Tax=Aeromicrobium sp. TaxID=1871063 RepID=UPI0030C5CCD6